MNNKINVSRVSLGEIIGIFFICTVVYLGNREILTSSDPIPNTLLALNLLENHTLHLDAFRNSYFADVDKGVFYSFAEGNNGHLSSTYPIGVAIVTFPLYVIFYAYLKWKYHFIDLTSPDFEVHRLFFEKLAAVIITASTVVIFYLSARLKFNRNISLISSFIFAFATNTWVTSSQGLWQHGISNFALVSVMFCLLKANHTSKGVQTIWLVLAGVACGLLPGIRPTPKQKEIANAIGSILFPREPGTYKLTFDLIAEGVSDFPKNNDTDQSYVFTVL